MKKSLWLMLIITLICIFSLSACDIEITLSDGSDSEATADTGEATTTDRSDSTEKATTAEESDSIKEETTTEESESTEEETTAVEETTADDSGLGENTQCQHEYGDWVTVKEATCKEEGQLVRTCKKCSATEKETVAKKDTHTEVVDRAVAPTCTKTGLTEGKHCSVCKKVLVAQQSIAALGHTEVVDPAVAATCSTEGKTEGKHCSVCNKVLVRQNSVQKLPHEYSDGICVVCGAPMESEGLEFTKNGTGYAVTGYGSCRDEVIVIPSTHNGLPVIEIASGAFAYFSDDCYLREIVIPDSVKNVRYNAFMVDRFFRITVGKNAVFEEQSIDAPGGCEIIYSSKNGVSANSIVSYIDCAPYVIHNSSESKCVTTEDGFVFIKSGSEYYLCDYTGTASEIVLPEGINGERYNISARCFFRNTTISKVKIGNGVIRIGETAFAASSLEEVDLAGKITEIPSFCFMECMGLENVEITDNITTIQNQAFSNSGIKTVTVGKNVTSVNTSAFGYCSDFDTLYFNSVNCTEVSGSAFGDVKTVVIGASVQSIPAKFLKGKASVVSVTFEENSSCKSIGYQAFDKTSITEITLPKSLTNISAAFEDCDYLEKINICCENIVSATTVFEDCGSKGDGIVVTVSPDVTVLPANFLKNCKTKALIFESGSSCKTIGKAFTNGRFPGVTLPSSVESFDRSIFDFKTLSIEEGNQNFKIQNSCFISIKDSRLIAVIDENYIIPEDVTTIAKGAFLESGVKHIYIPDTVQKLEDGCLSCSSVESISLPFIGTDRDTPTLLLSLFESEMQYGWTQIDLYPGTSIHKRYYVPPVFSKLTVRDTAITNGLVGLSMLKEVSIAATVTEIGKGAFADCGNLTHIYFGGTQEQWNSLKESGWLSDVSMNVDLTLNAKID